MSREVRGPSRSAVSRNSRALVPGKERSPSGRFATSWSALHGLGPSQEKEVRPPSAILVNVNARLGCVRLSLFFYCANPPWKGYFCLHATNHALQTALKTTNA